MNQEIQAIIDNRVQGVKNKDVDQATRDYSPAVILFDIVDLLERKGIQAVKEPLQKWLSSLANINNFEIKSTRIQASECIAYLTSFNHIDAVNSSGHELNMWWRETTCYQKTDGRWQITHALSSGPFNPDNGQASLGLKPEK